VGKSGEPRFIHGTMEKRSDQKSEKTTPPHHNCFTALLPRPPGSTGARKELLDFMVQGKINRGRHTDHPAGCHTIRTNQCPPPPSPFSAVTLLDGRQEGHPAYKKWEKKAEKSAVILPRG